jgi:hypothetical protein
MRALRHAARELVGLVVEDGFVALGALVSIAIGYVLSRDAVLGPTVTVGVLIVAMLAASLGVSLVRAARAVGRR